MASDLTPEEINEIEKEAKELYPDCTRTTDVSNWTTGIIEIKRTAYIKAATLYKLQLKERDEEIVRLKAKVISIEKMLSDSYKRNNFPNI